ncbi:group II intron reverse transcriptase/maturase [Candidatus Uabimicrobium sp. HlEnr_7]|uniref:group II intron reverse transcriptase/maturase n=1 Tax=Candidatus Uabimicrobium helgolandensis TaxID=3095367 RepID=UPI003556E2D3
MKKASINLQDLRRKIYIKAKAEKEKRFWGLYVHVCKYETLEESYIQAKSNNGSEGIDKVTFAEIELRGRKEFLLSIQKELREEIYTTTKYRKIEIPKAEKGKKRKLSIPTIKDRVVQGALKLILEPIFEADFQEGSYGYRPKRSQHQALRKVQVAILKGKTIVLDVDLKNYFDTIRHHILLKKIAIRVDDKQIMRLIKLILKSCGRKGVGQGSSLAPLLSNLYLNEVDKMLEKAKTVTTNGQYSNIEYARFADDIKILISSHPSQRWIINAITKRLKEELHKIEVEVNEDKTNITDLRKGDKITFLGFDIKRIKSKKGKWFPLTTPKMSARTKVIRKMKNVFKINCSRHILDVIDQINPIIQGWVNYFRFGNSTKCFSYVKDWINTKVRKHMQRASKRRGIGWKRWSKDFIQKLGLFSNYKVCIS